MRGGRLGNYWHVDEALTLVGPYSPGSKVITHPLPKFEGMGMEIDDGCGPFGGHPSEVPGEIK